MTDLAVICVCGHPRRHHYGREWTGTCIATIGEGSVCGCLTFEVQGHIGRIGVKQESTPGPRTTHVTPAPPELVPIVGPDTSSGTRPTLPAMERSLVDALAARELRDDQCSKCRRTIRPSPRKIGAWVGHARDCPRKGERADGP